MHHEVLYKPTNELVVHLTERKVDLVLDTEDRLPVSIVAPPARLEHVQSAVEVAHRAQETAVPQTHRTAVCVQVAVRTFVFRGTFSFAGTLTEMCYGNKVITTVLRSSIGGLRQA